MTKTSEYKKQFEEEGVVILPNFLNEEELAGAIAGVKITKDWWLSTAPKDIEKTTGEDYLKNTEWTKFTGGASGWGEIDKKLQKVYNIKRKHPNTYTYAFMRTADQNLILPFQDLLKDKFKQISDIVSLPITEFFSCFLSSYHRGCYLNDHTDEFVDEENLPKLAFILNLTKGWHPTHGGLLFVLNTDDSIGKVAVPTYNSLVLLKLPRRHFVSEVAQPVQGTRQAFTGWLR